MLWITPAPAPAPGSPHHPEPDNIYQYPHSAVLSQHNAAQVPDQTSETSGGEREWEEEDKAAERRYQETEGSNEPELHPVTGRATLFLHLKSHSMR